MRFLLALAISTVSLLAADVSGKWSGTLDVTVDGNTDNHTAVMILKQDGNKITGTAGPNEEKQMPIQNGAIDGNTIKFQIIEHNGEGPTVYVTLVADGDKMSGNATAEHDGQKMTAKFDLTRQKSS